MKRIIGVTATVLLSVFLLSGAAFSWQGRMSGMGDPYGLVSDESDFLTLPSRIVDGQGIQYYGDARFLYHNVTDLNWSARLNGPITLLGEPIVTDLNASGKWNSSGNLYDFSTLVGAAFPAGAGRMGIFFNYVGQRGDFSGDQTLLGGTTTTPDFISASSAYNMDSSVDNFNLRVIYGQPLGGDLKLGLEMQIAYQQEKNDFTSRLNSIFFDGDNITNLYGVTWDQRNDFIGELFPFMKPFDSSYWETIFKAGIEGKFGPSWVGMAVRGGPIFGGDNSWTSSSAIAVNDIGVTASNVFKLDGDTSGWRAGGDFWVRYPYSDTITIPFTVRVDYREKTRDGTGLGTASFVSGVDAASVVLPWSYKNEEKNLDIEAGGGIDMQVSKDLKVAAGLYYNFIHSREGFDVALNTGIDILNTPLIVTLNDNDFPEVTEHLIKLKFAVEQKMNTCILRGGLTAFGGVVSEDYSSNLGTPLLGGLNVLSNTGSLEGNIWGIRGSVGTTFNFQGYTIEPFIQAGYQAFSVDGPGSTTVLGGTIAQVPWALDKERNEVLVGAGVSVRF